MLELTNEQRKCLGLEPVDAAWEKITVKPGPNDDYATYAYLDGQRVRKVILSCEEESPKAKYCEYGSDEVKPEELLGLKNAPAAVGEDLRAPRFSEEHAEIRQQLRINDDTRGSR